MLSCALSKRLYHTQVSLPEVIDRRHTYAAVRENSVEGEVATRPGNVEAYCVARKEPLRGGKDQSLLGNQRGRGLLRFSKEVDFLIPESLPDTFVVLNNLFRIYVLNNSRRRAGVDPRLDERSRGRTISVEFRLISRAKEGKKEVSLLPQRRGDFETYYKGGIAPRVSRETLS